MYKGGDQRRPLLGKNQKPYFLLLPPGEKTFCTKDSCALFLRVWIPLLDLKSLASNSEVDNSTKISSRETPYCAVCETLSQATVVELEKKRDARITESSGLFLTRRLLELAWHISDSF